MKAQQFAESIEGVGRPLGAVLVVDDQNNPVSILTREDISRAVERYGRQQYAMINGGGGESCDFSDDGKGGSISWDGALGDSAGVGAIKMLDRSQFAELCVRQGRSFTPSPTPRL